MTVDLEGILKMLTVSYLNIFKICIFNFDLLTTNINDKISIHNIQRFPNFFVNQLMNQELEVKN